MTFQRRALGSSLALFALLALAGPAAAWAQDAPPTPDREQLVRFAQVHLAINVARDEFHGAIARVHDAEGRNRAREEVDTKIAAILEEHEMTREEYDDFILLISLDGDLRASFEEVMAELQDPS
ncbi:MAG: DUF4168 domain-containing protein [Gemmatimonadota bacterium]|nr:DUF4168 domain-containing protein [Gemmatimonadota bacterium]